MSLQPIFPQLHISQPEAIPDWKGFHAVALPQLVQCEPSTTISRRWRHRQPLGGIADTRLSCGWSVRRDKVMQWPGD